MIDSGEGVGGDFTTGFGTGKRATPLSGTITRAGMNSRCLFPPDSRALLVAMQIS
jgi:hypothetical protein